MAKYVKKKITIGKIIKPWGLKGGMKIYCFTENPDDLKELTNIFDIKNTQYKIKVSKTHENFAFVFEEKIKSRTEAEKLIGTELFINRADLPNITENHQFYYYDLIGMKVISEENNNEIGTVVNVMNFGASDILEIELLKEVDSIDKNSVILKNTKKVETILHPFSKDFVPIVNLTERYLVITTEKY